MSSPSAPRALAVASGSIDGKILWLLLLATVAYELAVSCFASIETVISVTPDDAAYYFKIAENIARGNGSTFDGINKTDGFQPLWTCVLVVIYALYDGPPATMLRLILVVQLVLLTISAVVLNAMLSKYVVAPVRLLCMASYVFLVVITSMNGMESALLIAMLVMLFAYGWRMEVFSRHRLFPAIGFGALLGLVMLSRLDMIFLAGSIYAFCGTMILIQKHDRRANLTRFLAIFIASSLPVLAYMIGNYVAFGSLTPISVQLKSSFPRILLDSPLAKLGPKHTAMAAIALCYLAYSVATLRRSRSGDPRRVYYRMSLMILSATVVLHYLHSLLFIEWALWYWHFVIYGLLVSLALVEPAEYLWTHRSMVRLRPLYRVAVYGLILLGSVYAHDRLDKYVATTDRITSYRTALWVRENTAPDAILALNDAGYFGFFSDRRVINLDGLVNNLEYQATLRDKKLGAYLKEKQVTYLVDHLFIKREDVVDGTYQTYSRGYFSHKYNVRSDSITVHREDELYRSPPFYDGIYKTVFVIWKMR